jgi:hypothetical protein
MTRTPVRPVRPVRAVRAVLRAREDAGPTHNVHGTITPR